MATFETEGGPETAPSMPPPPLPQPEAIDVMQDGDEISMEIKPGEVCKTPEQLLASPRFMRVVQIFNTDRERQGRPAVTVEQIRSNFALAAELHEFYKAKFRIAIQNGASGGNYHEVLADTVRRALKKVQQIDTSRAVGQKEVGERLSNAASSPRISSQHFSEGEVQALERAIRAGIVKIG